MKGVDMCNEKMCDKIKSCRTDFEAELIERKGIRDEKIIDVLYALFLAHEKIYDCVEWVEEMVE